MSCFVAFLIVLGVLLMAAKLSAQANERARQRRLYHQVARRFSGVYVSGGWWQLPSIRFRYGTTSVIAEVLDLRRGGGQILGVQIEWYDDHLRCEINSRADSAAQASSKMPAVPLNDAEFESRFAVHGVPTANVIQLLSRGTRWQLEHLRHVAGRPNLYVDIGQGRLQVRKRVDQLRIPEFEELIQRSLELYDQAMLARTVGIEFIDNDEAQLIVEAKCQVCGDDVVDQMVICQRCKTPHHHDCWQYFGSCSTYGCQGTKFTTPPVATRLQPPPANQG